MWQDSETGVKKRRAGASARDSRTRELDLEVKNGIDVPG